MYIDSMTCPGMSWAGPFCPKYCPFACGDLDPSNTWFSGLTQVHVPNGISIGSAVFARLANVTDRPTDRQNDRPRYSVSNSRMLRCVLIIAILEQVVKVI